MMTNELNRIIRFLSDYRIKKIDIDYLIDSLYTQIQMITEVELQSIRKYLDLIVENWIEERYLDNSKLAQIVNSDLDKIDLTCRSLQIYKTDNALVLDDSNDFLKYPDCSYEELCDPIRSLISFYKSKSGILIKHVMRDIHFKETFTLLGIENMETEKPKLDKITYRDNVAYCDCHWSALKLIEVKK